MKAEGTVGAPTCFFGWGEGEAEVWGSGCGVGVGEGRGARSRAEPGGCTSSVYFNYSDWISSTDSRNVNNYATFVVGFLSCLFAR
jgi:hypothetical protein